MVTSIFYASVVVMIAKHELVSILIVAMTHFLGIYTARLISESLKRKVISKKMNRYGIISRTFFKKFSIISLKIAFIYLYQY